MKDSSYQKDSYSKFKLEESEKIKKVIGPGEFIISCDENGQELNSLGLSQKFQDWANQGNSTFHFIIGGAFGLDESIINLSDFSLSLSKMTFTHQMVRLFLLEQIYRSFTILKNQNYHH